jgi:hypothetical protein
MHPEHLTHCITLLRQAGIQLEQGLTQREVVAVERLFGLRFPPDLRTFLRTALPVSPPFPDWRAALKSPDAREQIQDRLDWPLEGFLAEVEARDFWLAGLWGPCPDTVAERLACVRKAFEGYPPLIPVCAHRFLPSAPHEAGNPVYSVFQADIQFYGFDLAAYLVQEFHGQLPIGYTPALFPRHIPFWEDMVRGGH